MKPTLARALGRYAPRLVQDQFVPTKKWLCHMLWGIIASRSLMLSQIARSLREPAKIGYVIKRLSRHLNSERLDVDALFQRHLEHVAEMLKTDRGEGIVLAVDYTDIEKPYARTDPNRGMEGVAVCHNGSSGTRTPGLEVVAIDATGSDGTRIPVLMRPYSKLEDGHRSKTKEFMNDVRMVSEYVGPRAWWTMDRGFDGNAYFDELDEMGLRWICRLVVKKKNSPKKGRKDRKLALEDGTVLDVSRAVEDADFVGHFKVRAGRKLERKLGMKAFDIEVYTKKVWLTRGTGRARSVYVKRGSEKTLLVAWAKHWDGPMVLLASEWLTTKRAALKVYKAYRLRWAVEETIRQLKDSRGWGVRLEDVRALSLEGIRRLVLLAVIVNGFMLWMERRSKALVRRAVEVAQASGGREPMDLRYRIFRGAGVLLGKMPSAGIVRWTKRTSRAETGW